MAPHNSSKSLEQGGLRNHHINYMNKQSKLTEDETILILINFLKETGWEIPTHSLGRKRGTDIVAQRKETRMLIEVKGARAGDRAPNKKRKLFDSGQIKTHFGVAIVKSLEDKRQNPNSIIAIAHPDDLGIRKAIGSLIPYLKNLGIKHFWVSGNGDVIEED